MGPENLKNIETQDKLDVTAEQAIEDEGRELPDEKLEGISGGWPQIRTPLPPPEAGTIV